MPVARVARRGPTGALRDTRCRLAVTPRGFAGLAVPLADITFAACACRSSSAMRASFWRSFSYTSAASVSDRGPL